MCLASGTEEVAYFTIEDLMDHDPAIENITCIHSHSVPKQCLAPDLMLFGISERFNLDDVVLGKKIGEGIVTILSTTT